ncbi:sulfotransferase [Amphritea japonica]|uniref:Sulfotransferase n=1 Tax=Amphritea japonica ATCC BAA-1530 TaxID=1278309 RepID=A0A7R6SRT3_9GAMM|nr:sulfotransferase [Amphritea japonica]BBB25495.1 conserved hypothetical protein [Amphritea japonica ATCC BAA-1530]
MNFQLKLPPVAIGGIGGSGTRLIADIIQAAGFFIGETLNHPLDNLYFTLLFKRPDWVKRFPSTEEIDIAIHLFQKAMTQGLHGKLSSSEIAYLEYLATLHNAAKSPTGADRLIAQKIISSNAPDFSSHVGWGWKEPNTHIFLPEIARKIKNIRYIHVVRNGLDMAYSKNQQQLRNWGEYINNEPPAVNAAQASLSLDYWIKANQRAIQLGDSLLPNRFLLVNYDKLCSEPTTEIPRIIEFLEAKLSTHTIQEMNEMVAPISVGRYQNHDTTVFTQHQLDAVTELGFDIETNR